MSSKSSYYAVANGRTNGIFHTWKECSESVTGYKNAIYKKFISEEEANEFIRENTAICHIETLPKDHLELSYPRIGYPTIGYPTIGYPTIDYYVYTDGACSNNGRANACAGIGIYFGPDDPRNVSKRIQGKQTNNTAELIAIIDAYTILETDLQFGKQIGIVTDSEYAIKCVTSYGKKCEKNEWIKEIPNKELVRQIYTLYKDLPHVHFIHVPAHTSNQDDHSIGNDGADRLANRAIGLDTCPYNNVI